MDKYLLWFLTTLLFLGFLKLASDSMHDLGNRFLKGFRAFFREQSVAFNVHFYLH